MSLANRVNDLVERVEKAAIRSGRNLTDIDIVAVSKRKPAGMVIEASKAGIIHFGENRFQECPGKIAEVKEKIGQKFDDLIWHFIGHIQSNKVRNVAELFDRVDSVDSLRIAEKLNRIAGDNSQDGKTKALRKTF